MNKRNILLLFALLVVLLVPSAFADDITCAIVSPSSSSTIGATTVFNVSLAGGTGNASVTVDWNASSSVSRNTSTLSLFMSQANLTGAALMANGSINRTLPSDPAIDDTNGYTITASVKGTGGQTQCTGTLTSMTFDLSDPSAPTGITFSNPVEDAETITATINRANANRCWVKFGGNPKQAMTLSGSTCTYIVRADAPANSDYQVVFSADDRVDSEAAAATQFMTVRAKKSDGGGIYSGAQVVVNEPTGVQAVLGQNSNPFAPKDNTMTWVIVAVVVYLVFFRKK